MPYNLITFFGCPNVAGAKALLNQAHLNYTEIDRDSLSEFHPLRAYSSPSLLKDDQLVFGSRTDSHTGGCTLALPSLAELKLKISALNINIE